MSSANNILMPVKIVKSIFKRAGIKQYYVLSRQPRGTNYIFCFHTVERQCTVPFNIFSKIKCCLLSLFRLACITTHVLYAYNSITILLLVLFIDFCTSLYQRDEFSYVTLFLFINVPRFRRWATLLEKIGFIWSKKVFLYFPTFSVKRIYFSMGLWVPRMLSAFKTNTKYFVNSHGINNDSNRWDVIWCSLCLRLRCKITQYPNENIKTDQNQFQMQIWDRILWSVFS